MPAPSSYTESTIRSFMVERLSDVATILGWTGPENQITRAVYATERAYRSGVGAIVDISSATDMPKLEALAEREAWRAAVGALAARVNMSGAGTSVSMSQAYEHAKEMLSLAESECASLGVGQNVITVTPISYVEDPYVIQEDEVLA